MFDQLFTSVANVFGVSAVYRPAGNDPVICDVVVEHDVLLQPSSYDARVVETGTTIEARYSDVAAPLKGSTFEIGDKTYTVERITDNDRVFVTMVVIEGV